VPALVLAPISIGLVTGSGAAQDVLIALCTFGCCWVLGFLYADGRLTRVPVGLVLVVGAAAVALGLWVADVQGEQYAADDVRDVPLAVLLLGTGGVLLLLRAQPAFAWLVRLRRSAAVLRFLTDRVVTAVLWAGPAVGAAPLVVDALGIEHRGWPTAAWVLLLVAVVVLGWPERLGELRIGRRRVLRSPVYRFEDNVVAHSSVSSR
jgi:hypothetical protein